MSQTVVGQFGERALERIISKDTFVPATVQNIVIAKRTTYYSGSVTGMSVKHTSPSSYVDKLKKRDRNIRDVGVSPKLYLKLNIDTVQSSVLISITPSELTDFGSFKYLHGKFNLDVEDIEVKVTANQIRIRDFGVFNREENVRDTMTYTSWSHSRSQVLDRGYECGKVIEQKLKKSWAISEGIYSTKWRIETVENPEYSTRIKLICVRDDIEDSLKFSISMNDWDENKSIRNLIENVAGGVPDNLEKMNVWVSLEEYSSVEPVAKDGEWNLYCYSDKPNVVSRTIEKYQHKYNW